MTYFQPVLDALRYKVSPLTLQGPAVILEGKFDYYPFRYLLKRLEPDSDINCYSANGAGEMGLLISLFRGLNVPFLVLLDADKQGKNEKSRYIKEYLLNHSQVMTLDEADPALDGFPFEQLFGSDVASVIEDQNFSQKNSLKSNACSLFQLLFSISDYDTNFDETLINFQKILDQINLRLLMQ